MLNLNTECREKREKGIYMLWLFDLFAIRSYGLLSSVVWMSTEMHDQWTVIGTVRMWENSIWSISVHSLCSDDITLNRYVIECEKSAFFARKCTQKQYQQHTSTNIQSNMIDIWRIRTRLIYNRQITHKVIKWPSNFVFCVCQRIYSSLNVTHK